MFCIIGDNDVNTIYAINSLLPQKSEFLDEIFFERLTELVIMNNYFKNLDLHIMKFSNHGTFYNLYYAEK